MFASVSLTAFTAWGTTAPMRTLFPLTYTVLLASALVSCTSPSRQGLPPNSSPQDTGGIAGNLLPQGIAVGDINATSALLWVRTHGPAMVQVEWATPSAWKTISKMATAVSPVAKTPRLMTDAESDFTLSIPLQGLNPGTRYRYHVLVGRVGAGTDSSPLALAARGELSTAPAAGDFVPLTFAWSGDLGGQGHCRQGLGGYPIFDVMRRQQPDFFLFLGDSIYSDDVCPSPPNEPGADFTVASLSDYRARHRYQRGAVAMRRFLETVPVYMVWDDHEVWNNFAGSVDIRMPDGRRALLEYWPITRSSDDANRLHRSIRYGANLEMFILDTRSYRSRNADPDGPEKTMLGASQLQWLLDGLKDSTATWKIIVTSVPLSIPKNGGWAVPGNDGWAGGPNGTGFERERQVIVDTIMGRRMKNIVFIAGDVHFTQANSYDPDSDGIPDFHEFVAGPLSAAPGRMVKPSLTLNPTTLAQESGYYNFGLVRVTATSFEVSFVDNDGMVRFSHRLTAR